MTKNNKNNINNLISSSVGTCAAEILTLPICTTKTNYQKDLTQKSIVNVAKQIYKTKGVYGFFNSSFSAVGSQIVSTSSKYTFYQMIKNMRNTEKHDIKNNIINGGCAGVLASIFSHPFDVVKIHHQTSESFIKSLKKNGPMLFYRGYSKSIYKKINKYFS